MGLKLPDKNLVKTTQLNTKTDGFEPTCGKADRNRIS